MPPEIKSADGASTVLQKYDETETSDGEQFEVDWTEEEEQRLVRR
jgi:hypothetical protein